MGFEGYQASDDEAIVALESFKGNPDAPFETVGKNEDSPSYPHIFLNKLGASWSRVCDLMAWEKADQPADWNFFRVSKDPFEVVTLIQKKILAEGGSLPNYDVDGKFGPETQGALNDVMSKKTEILKTRIQVDVATDLTDTADVATEADQEPVWMDKFIQEKRGEMIAALPRIEASLQAAGLNIYSDWFEDPNFSDIDVLEFQMRAREFREGLVAQEPRLEPLNRVVPEVIQILKAKIKKIDLTKINSMEELTNAMEKLSKDPEVKINLKNVLSNEEMEELFSEVDFEVLMSFVMSLFQEFTVIMAGYFKKNEQDFERIMKILEDEFLIYVRPKVEEALRDGGADTDVVVRVLPAK